MYRYLYVVVDDIQSVIKIEDNREENKNYSTETEDQWS